MTTAIPGHPIRKIPLEVSLMEHDSLMSSSLAGEEQQEIPGEVKDQLMFNVLEKEMTTEEKEKKAKDEYLTGKS
ncbi:hypothetical protein [Brevibacillus parabrevis]|uniref:hypothetical protein n=1 Tax=Brevibacillus parabrevis TaxID=54914 RepID=UPI00113BDA39|nr:hypothetical protein [Brevibacillus parabrevis]MED1723080.1 hypothetical protein [Brevibacillus parabrevis]TGV29051.1 hypothetical protein EN829_041625 [Mesorhizobium sp. M00.F.Ca.ET.186.01.1.1]